MDTLINILTAVRDAVWGIPTMILLLGTGLYFTVRLKGMQFTRFPLACKLIFQKEEGGGEISPFASLCTSLAATIGTGSIVGVATALRIGGAGALFWMWISALLGMATKYAESLLAVKFRTKDENGQYCGGPMYYIQNGMGRKWIPLAKAFAVFGLITALLGCGTFPQVNSITESINGLFGIPTWIIALAVSIITAFVILGGIQSIAKVTEFIVPIMAVLYIGGSVFAIAMNIKLVPEVFRQIFTSAFNPSAAAGGISGTAAMSLIMMAMRTGIARGIYTNEAGLGSSPIVAASAKTNSCVREGLISMTGVFFTTIVVCSMTGFVIISSDLLNSSELDGVLLASTAFDSQLPMGIGQYIVSIGIAFFSITTIIGWCYYGERCLVYLLNSTKGIKIYKIIYLLMLALAPFLTLKSIWTIADITNALMAFPNLIALLGLRKTVISETRSYFGINKMKTKNKCTALKRFLKKLREDRKMDELHLFGKKIFLKDSPVLIDYKPDSRWEDYFTVMGGNWEQKDGWLIGTETGNKGGILFTKQRFDDDVMITFTGATVLPAENDVNAVFCAEWDEKTDYLGESYVCGLNGWYEHKSGIERNGRSPLHASTTLYRYRPGEEVRMCAGAVHGHCFMVVDNVLVSELIDPEPLKGGHLGFSPYCTRLKVKDIKIQKIKWEPFYQEYAPDFITVKEITNN